MNHGTLDSSLLPYSIFYARNVPIEENTEKQHFSKVRYKFVFKNTLFRFTSETLYFFSAKKETFS